jgi:hypothetical protein
MPTLVGVAPLAVLAHAGLQHLGDGAITGAGGGRAISGTVSRCLARMIVYGVGADRFKDFWRD